MGNNMKIYPTLAHLTGATEKPGHVVDGQDLAVLLTGAKDKSRANRLLIHFPHCHHGSYFTTYREDDWKLIYYYNPEHPERPDCILYNLKTDPYEKQEVSKQYPEKTMYMLRRMVAQLEAEGAQYPIGFEKQTVKPNIEYLEK